MERIGFVHALAPVSVLLGAIARAERDAAARDRWTARAVALYRELGDEASAAALLAGATRAGA